LVESSSRLEDSGAELLDRLSGFWSAYGRIALRRGAVVATGLVVFFTSRSRATAEDQARAGWGEASLYYFQATWSRSRDRAPVPADQFGITESGLDGPSVMGDASFWSNDFKTAVARVPALPGAGAPGTAGGCATRSLAYALENDSSREARLKHLARRFRQLPDGAVSRRVDSRDRGALPLTRPRLAAISVSGCEIVFERVRQAGSPASASSPWAPAPGSAGTRPGV